MLLVFVRLTKYGRPFPLLLVYSSSSTSNYFKQKFRARKNGSALRRGNDSTDVLEDSRHIKDYQVISLPKSNRFQMMPALLAEGSERTIAKEYSVWFDYKGSCLRHSTIMRRKGKNRMEEKCNLESQTHNIFNMLHSQRAIQELISAPKSRVMLAF